jgi:DNA invertase Pin-like site-specific DNA recombinase
VQQRDLDVEVSRGVDRQAVDNVKCAQELHLIDGPLPEAQHFTDNDRSASQFATKERERWADLLELVRGGSVSHVLVWLLDRAYRTTDGAEQLLAACRQGGAVIVQTAGLGTICDPNSPDDIFRLKLAGLIAEYEVAKMAQRQRRAKKAAADMGVSHGGKRRFGYEPGMHEVRESEAELVRDIAARLLAGESLSSCAKRLNDQGVPTPTFDGTCNACDSQVVRLEGSTFRHADPELDDDHAALVTQWKGPNLRTMILRPHLAALRVHGKEADGKTPKVIGKAAWPPILSVEDHDRLKHLLGDPKRRTSTSNARVYLLAGLAKCAECGEVLRGKTRSKADQRRVYSCATGRHAHRAVEDVDALVVGRVIARLEQTDASGALVDNTAQDLVTALAERLEVLKADRKAKAVELAAAGLDSDSLADILEGYATNIERVAEDLANAREGARRPEVALQGMTGSQAAQAWEAAALGRQRAVLSFLTTSITLRGADHGRRRLIQAEDVHVTFREFGG